MTANPNSVWGCQAREFIRELAVRVPGGIPGQGTSRSIEGGLALAAQPHHLSTGTEDSGAA